MVRIRVFAKVIAEDVYVRDVESSTPSRPTLPLENEKILMEVIHDPEKVSIGRLVIQFEETSRRLHRKSVVLPPGQWSSSFTNLRYVQISRGNQVSER